MGAGRAGKVALINQRHPSTLSCQGGCRDCTVDTATNNKHVEGLLF